MVSFLSSMYVLLVGSGSSLVSSSSTAGGTVVGWNCWYVHRYQYQRAAAVVVVVVVVY
jgi:hypothetical protein